MNENKRSVDGIDEALERPPLRGWPLVSVSLLIVFEMSWAAAGYRAVIPVGALTTLPLAVLTLSGVMLAAYGAAYFLENMRLLRNIQLALYALLLIICLVAGGKILLPDREQSIFKALFELDVGALLMFFFVLWMWWRGIGLARVRMRPEVAWQRFQVGLAAFLGIVFLSNWMGGQAPGLGWFAVFLFVGFLAILSARAAYVDIGAGERVNPLDRRWVLGMAGFIGLLVILAAILGSLLTGQGALLLDWLAQAIRLVVVVMFVILAIPALVLGVLFGGFMAWLRRALGLEGVDLTPDQDLDLFSLAEFDLPEVTPEALPANLQSILFWGLVALGLVWLFILLRRRAERWRSLAVGAPESLLEPGDAGRLLRKALQDAVDDWANRLRLKLSPNLPVIRRIYIQMLNLAAILGRPRPPTKTPLEFRPLLGEKLNNVEVDLDVLTQAYLRVRYGEMPETLAEIEQVEAAWLKINQQAQKVKSH